ncbi:hypothetical protein ACKWTF_006704 [Chironomus riparius]
MNTFRKQGFKVFNQFNRTVFRSFSMMSENHKDIWMERAKKIVPKLTNDMHKGEAGRIGIIGGSLEYTGAPYYAGIAALKVGCDLVHIFCPQSAALAIKSYSPELIVHPLLDSDNALDLIEPWLSRLHVLVIGSGLGRDRNILHTVSELIMCCKKSQKPLVIDADGLFLITQNTSLLNDYQNVILTPNAMELFRLIGDTNEKLHALSEKIGKNVIVLEKAMNDRIYDTETMSKVECPQGGTNRRCGGQGDLLAGAVAVFYHWALNLTNKDNSGQPIHDFNPAIAACYGATYLIKYCNRLAYEKYGRSMTAVDMIDCIHTGFNEYFEHENSKLN